jgi:endonuclease/exonuclease/phosphatase family metal-dependent hydrolase
MYFLNIVLAILTFVAYILPFLAPKFFPFLSVLTLFMPLFFIFNGLFFLYWLLQFRKKMFLSALVLLMGITFINRYYKFSAKDFTEEDKDFTVMSYNVRLFNVFKWIERDDIATQILTFINDKNPDILCIQEFSSSGNIDLKVYRHRYVLMDGNQVRTGQAIFSKFPIINQGNIVFPNSNNSVIFADIKRGTTIIRIYNMHLQSIKISPDVSEINENIEVMNQEKSHLLFNRISKAFTQQQEQTQLFKAHKEACNYPMIICGDMNNSAFSYVYRNIKGKLKDSFEQAGKGFGATYKFKYYPARIDYIFADENMKVKKFETFSDFENSDHFPIMAKMSFEE